MKHIFHGHITCLLTLALIMGISLFSIYRAHTDLPPHITHATAVMHPTKGNNAFGVVHFTQTAAGLHIIADVHNLTPGTHGFHVHEFGDCACDDAVCTGGHYNPTNMPHAGPQDKKRHIGDFGNITADQHGDAHYELLDHHATLNGAHSIIGRGLIIHADPDDLVSQPTGNAGARIACGVIGIAKDA